MCEILKPTKETIFFDGKNVSSEEYRDVLGYLPQDFGYYPNFFAYDFLMYMVAFSGGMKRRVGIDPKERVGFRDLIDKLGNDRVVVLSTYIVSDIEQIADRILILKEGQFVYDVTLDEMKEGLEEFYLNQFKEGEI